MESIISVDKQSASPLPPTTKGGTYGGGSKLEKARLSLHPYIPITSRKSSREQSLDPNNQRLLEMKMIMQADDMSDSETEKSPSRYPKNVNFSQFGFGPKMGRNIIDNLGDDVNHQHEVRRWNTIGDKSDPSENHDQSNIGSNTTMVLNPSAYNQPTHKKSHFASLSEKNQQMTHAQMMQIMRRKNQTDFYDDAARNSIAEDDDSDNEFMDSRERPRRTQTARRLTSMANPNATEDFKKKYRDFVQFASGSYAIVERCQRKEDQADFVMKFMTTVKISDKIKNSLGVTDAEAKDLAKKICENELNISKMLGSHVNISSIEDSYVDKAKGEYRFFSRLADFATLLSDTHMSMVKAMNHEGIEELTPELIKQYFRDIVDGLLHSTLCLTLVHAKKIVHRDLKLENILVFSDGHAKLTDFSVSLSLDKPQKDLLKLGTTKICQSPEVWANPNYMGLPHDIWCLGVILWMLLYKNSPFKSTNEQTLKQEVMTFVPDFTDKTLDSNLIELLRGMLNTDETKRWDIKRVAGCLWLA